MSEDIDRIITRYLEGSITPEQEEKLNKWLKQNEDHARQLASVDEIWKTPVGYPSIVNMKDEWDKIWKRFQRGNGDGRQGQSRSIPFHKVAWRYAAALVLIVGLAFIIGYHMVDTPETDVLITKIERINPAGQKSKIQLPDGSQVWLNAGSRLSYDSDFNSTSRKLNLSGEAYFEVVKNPEIPFEVFTDDLLITAIGTSFNVQAFRNNREQIALNTGKVKIECIDDGIACAPSYLNPGDFAEFNKNRGSLELSKFEDDDPFAWKDGNIVFRHATFDEVLEVLSRWYNVEFIVEGKLKQEWNYTTTFENVVLENVLASLKFSENINYKFEGSSTVKLIL